jgi:peptidoglycan/xylan/chitin deacetylase (PgdA/CDA1 family)
VSGDVHENRSVVPKLRSLLSAPAALAYWAGVAGGRTRRDGYARILMLHGTPRRYARLLERVLGYAARNFDVVPLAALAAGSELRGKLAITFDDGLRNNVEVAYPILQRLGLCATFFVCPGLVEARGWLWNQEARQRLCRLGPVERQELAFELECGAEIESIVYRLKRLPLRERQHAEARIRALTPRFRATDAERHDFDLAGWSELRGLDPRVVTVGSHTLTHPILPSLGAAELEEEVGGSRRLLEAKLGHAADVFAYPNGDADPATVSAVRRHYAAAVTVEEGLFAPGGHPHLIPRINVPGSVLRFALSLHRAHFLATPISQSGNQVASSGNTVMSAMQSTIMKKKGSEASAT